MSNPARRSRRLSRAVGGAAALALGASALAAVPTTPAVGVPAADDSPVGSAPEVDKSSIDDLPHPLGERYRELREQAVADLVTGDARLVRAAGPDGSRSIKVDGAYVQYDVERTANLFTILSDFGDQTMPEAGGEPGPAAGQIPRPDRRWNGGATDDNSTYWEQSFDRAHYLDLMFGEKNSMRDFYAKQSNGRFALQGDVSDWVSVPYNEARYGSNDVPQTDGYWSYVRDTADAWYADQLAQGRTKRQVKRYLAQFDVWDRYDHDNDGDFDEPDGYIDHFQAIHAGEGEEAGGGAQGEDAIWSHRWYAYSDGIGSTGPAGNLNGGTQIGTTGIWIGDYTTEPENGGLGVFTHEFGHDLELPDLYDTAGGDNSTAFWTLMSGGSWLNTGKDSIGTRPGYMGAWEKLQLGWLDHTTVEYGRNSTLTVDEAALPSATGKQAVVVTLPDKEVVTEYNEPLSGEWEWWSGSGDGLSNTLTRTVDLTGLDSAELTTGAWHAIEADYDFLYVEASTDGETWEALGDPVTGASDGWTELSYDLSAYAGAPVDVRFRYATDTAVAEPGAFLDDIAVTSGDEVVLSDDVEDGENGWTADGFTRTTGTDTQSVEHFYLAENRTYTGYDRTLRTGPYNFGWGETRPDWVERFPYQNGLLVTYYDGAFGDNNTSTHPGGGLVLPVDARPAPIMFSDGAMLGNRRQPFDATFGLEPTDEVVFHNNGTPRLVPERAARPVFDDSVADRYWSPENPGASVQVAGSGTRITVLRSLRGGRSLQLQVRFAR